METLILWGIPVVGLFAGLYFRLFRSYMTFLNILFSVYVAVWSESVVTRLFRLPLGAEPYTSAAAMLLCAAAVWVLLHQLSVQLCPGKRKFASPPQMLDKIGGGVFGFLAGMALINFAALLICVAPVKTRLASVVSLAETERSCSARIIFLTRLTDGLSLQLDPGVRQTETLEKLIRKADPPPPPDDGKKKKGKAAPAKRGAVRPAAPAR